MSLVLWLLFACFAGFALVFFCWPAAMMRSVGVNASSREGKIEIRAMYGGLQIGVAVFVGFCGVEPGLTRLGILAGGIGLGGLGAGRVIGIALAKGAPRLMRVLLALELGGAGLAFGALRWL